MNMLIVYDSYFNNTKQIANAIAEAFPGSSLKPAKEVSINEIRNYNLIIAGSPTRAFRPTEDLSKLIKSLPLNALKNCKVAAFDTRIDLEAIKQKMWKKMVHAGGYAAPVIHKRLIKKGATGICEPEGFYVLDNEGPLKPGELERAYQWGLFVRLEFQK